MFQRDERRQVSADGYSAHELVVLPDGQLMYVRTASLVAAKDLLAAQRAVERRMLADHAAHRPHAAADLSDLSGPRDFAAELTR